MILSLKKMAYLTIQLIIKRLIVNNNCNINKTISNQIKFNHLTFAHLSIDTLYLAIQSATQISNQQKYLFQHHLFNQNYNNNMYSPNSYQGKENNKELFNYSQVRASTPIISNNSPNYTNSNLNYSNINLKQSASTTHRFTQAKSQENLHILKLQSRALQQLRKLQHQKFQINTLTEQTQQLMRLCDQQKSYIKSVNIDMLRQQYEEELKYLSEQRNKLMDMISIMREQKQFANETSQQKINSARMDNLILSEKIEQALLKKQQFLKIKHQNNIMKEKYQQTINEQQDKLHQYRNVERKVAISLKEIQRLRKQYLDS